MYDVPEEKAEMWMVMIDSLDPLEIAELPKGYEVEDYVHSWRTNVELAPDGALA